MVHSTKLEDFVFVCDVLLACLEQTLIVTTEMKPSRIQLNITNIIDGWIFLAFPVWTYCSNHHSLHSTITPTKPFVQTTKVAFWANIIACIDTVDSVLGHHGLWKCTWVCHNSLQLEPHPGEGLAQMWSSCRLHWVSSCSTSDPTRELCWNTAWATLPPEALCSTTWHASRILSCFLELHLCLHVVLPQRRKLHPTGTLPVED